MPPTGKPKKAKPTKKAATRAVERDPWVELQRGLVQDRPLPFSGQLVEIQVHPPGTRMLRSQAVELGVTDYVEVDGPAVVEGFRMVLTPAGPAPMSGSTLGTEGMKF